MKTNKINIPPENPLDAKLDGNPFRATGLAEKIEAECRGRPMTAEDMREMAADSDDEFCMDMMKSLERFLKGHSCLRDVYDTASLTWRRGCAINIVRAFPKTDNTIARCYLHEHIYPLLARGDLDHVIDNVAESEKWRHRLIEMRDDYISWAKTSTSRNV